MEDVDRGKFISVRNLLEDIGAGIGKANFSLWKESESPYGILAVKTAKVSVDFEMTSSAIDRNESFSLNAPPLPFLGAKTLTLSSDTYSKENRELNRANIILEIVSIAPERIESSDNKIKENLLQAINLIRIRIPSLKRSEKDKKRINDILTKAEKLLMDNKIEEARNSLIKIAEEYSLNIS